MALINAFYSAVISTSLDTRFYSSRFRDDLLASAGQILITNQLHRDERWLV